MKIGSPRAIWNVGHKKLMSQALLVLLLLANFFIPLADCLAHGHEAKMEQRQFIATPCGALPCTFLISAEGAAGNCGESASEKTWLDYFDLCEDDLGIINGWDCKYSFAFTYFAPGSETMPRLEPVRSIDKPPQHT